MYNWLQKKTGPSSKLLSTDAEYDSHSTQKLSVLYVLPEEDTEALKKYTGFAAGYDDIQFAHSHNSAHAEKLEISQKYGFVVFRTFDDGHKFLLDDKAISAETMKSFLEGHRFPIVSEFD